MSPPTVGVVGLGNMGAALAANLVGAGLAVVAHDAVGPDRVPPGGEPAHDVAEVARRSDVVVLSLPDVVAGRAVTDQLVAATDRRATHVIDTSTVGVTAAEELAGELERAGVGYVDAPVSGGVAGARARTIMVMYAGSDAACAVVEPVIAALSDRRRRVGDRAGMAQALKLANNFLSATALVAASEAVAFGLSVGLEMDVMLEVINGSSGQSRATSDKFVNEILPGRFASGFANSLMAKDLALYLEEVDARHDPSTLGRTTAAVWSEFAVVEPGVDFTRIFPFVAGPPSQ
ncbi:MAG TPA: NAD(P)-dependent oxidoreductase [Acidimicrobiales bacterium]